MKILQVVPSLLPEAGGPSRTVPGLCRALAARGTDLTLFTTHQPGETLTLNPSTEPYEVLLSQGAEQSPAGARRIYEAIKMRAREFEVLHVHSIWNFVTTAAAAAARRVGVPYVLAPLGMLSNTCLRQSHFFVKRAYAALGDRRTIEGAARLHLASRDELHTLVQGWFRYPKHFIARNGTTTCANIQHGSFRQQFPELKDRRIMLFFGRLHSIKGLDLQLEALALLKSKHPDLIWVLVGPDGGEWNRLRTAIRAAGLDGRVRWIGALMGDDRFAALADADVLVHTSFYECQAMTINEALGVGVPLVITDSVNYGDVQTEGAGYVVKRDPAAVAAAIDSVLQNPDKSAAMRQAGRRFAESELSWSRIADSVIAAYEQVLAERGSETSFVASSQGQGRALSADL